MKATGILRRIDDLGRIVIPKEIRKNLKIKEGEYLEIFINVDNIILKRYSFLDKSKEIADLCIKVGAQFLNKEILIADRKKVIAVSTKLEKEYLGKEISNELNQAMLDRKAFSVMSGSNLKILNNNSMAVNGYFWPLLLDSDVVGVIILIGTEQEITNQDKKVIEFMGNIINEYLD